MDISYTPTLSSLAFSIYRNKYLQKDMNIPIITGQIYNDLVKGYTHQYDVNSLYPFVMKEYAMPVGTPT